MESLRKLPDSTVRFVVPPGSDLSFVLTSSLGSCFRLYGLSRPVSAFLRGAIGRMVRMSAPPRKGERQRFVRVTLAVAGSRLRLTLRFPSGSLAASRLKVQFRGAPRTVASSLRIGPGGPAVTFQLPLQDRH